MLSYEFRVIPAPRGAGKSSPQAKSHEISASSDFQNVITGVLSRMATDGWEFVGQDQLPAEKRRVLDLSGYNPATCMVFRKPSDAAAVEPKRIARATDEKTPAPADRVQRPRPPVLILENPVYVPGQPLPRRPMDHVPEPTENIAAIPRIKSERRVRALSALERAVRMEGQLA